ncbi:unnamed protein product [Allacma fusca]|uniref:Vitellogenin receptor n=1 Tax=Allacma fusca TaxID=39272 RepID=A0A8J2M4D8_9HEXA|nr:unnamed protein product [Allacma fusca]
MKICTLFISLILVAQNYGQPCDEGQVLCEGTEDKCIPQEFVCDGTYIDCPDGWDETGCPCPPGQVLCPNSTVCIPPSWICNYHTDCPGGEDEIDCPPCPGYTCEDGYCIPTDFICDGWKDCSGGDDERDCICDGFECSDGTCISEEWRCDGERDCLDDEIGCECGPTDWVCDDGLCVPEYWVCDGWSDCRDRSDELNCTSQALPAIPLGKQPVFRAGAVQSPLIAPMPTTVTKLSESKVKRNKQMRRAEKVQISCSSSTRKKKTRTH